jgi:MFS family permease
MTCINEHTSFDDHSHQLSKKQVERGLRAVIKDGIMSHLMDTFTGGVFLTGLALKLGATNAQIGLLAAILPLSQVFQIPAILLIDRAGSRKKVTISATVLSRLAWLLVAASPFFLTPAQSLWVLIGSVLLFHIAQSIGGCAWTSWLRDLVPEGRLGRFFSLRTRISILLGLCVSLPASRMIDNWQQHSDFQLGGYSLLFAAGFVAGMTGIWFISRVPDITMKARQTDLLTHLKMPFRDVNYRKLISFMAVWNFAINLAVPFFTVYMMKRLGMSMSSIMIMTILGQIANLLFLGLWGKWADHFSNKSVLAVSGPLFMCTIFAWTFTSVADVNLFTWPLLAVIHVVMGASRAGVTLATGNIGMKLAPRGEATVYLVALSLSNALAAGSAPIIGGKLADLLAQNRFSFILQWVSPQGSFMVQPINFRHWDFLFGLAFLIGLTALRLLARVEEKGNTDRNLIVREFMAFFRLPFRLLSRFLGNRRSVPDGMLDGSG